MAYPCTFDGCNQICITPYNLKRHIERKHQTTGEEMPPKKASASLKDSIVNNPPEASPAAEVPHSEPAYRVSKTTLDVLLKIEDLRKAKKSTTHIENYLNDAIGDDIFSLVNADVQALKAKLKSTKANLTVERKKSVAKFGEQTPLESAIVSLFFNSPIEDSEKLKTFAHNVEELAQVVKKFGHLQPAQRDFVQQVLEGDGEQLRRATRFAATLSELSSLKAREPSKDDEEMIEILTNHLDNVLERRDNEYGATQREDDLDFGAGAHAESEDEKPHKKPKKGGLFSWLF